jgi:hypothetical protein
VTAAALTGGVEAANRAAVAANARAPLDRGVLRARIGMGGRYTGRLPEDRGHYGEEGDTADGGVMVVHVGRMAIA